jgi:uncharacterized hydrophobic protein (TIGR00271 family)
MQILEIFLDAGEGAKGAQILKDLEIKDFNLIKSETGDVITVRHPLDKTDTIIAKFGEEFKFTPDDRRGIIISTPDVILPKVESGERKDSGKSAWQVMVEYGENNSTGDSRYFALFFFSAVVATLGLITNNVAVVVGAMIIAPAFGPIASAAIGIVAGRMDLFRNGLKSEILGIGLAIMTAAILGLVLPGLEMNDSLRVRMYPTIFDLLLGLAAGAAGGYVLVSGKSSGVVGVMVAAALVPVMAAIGIGMVFFDPMLVLGSFLLLLVNVVTISLAMVLVFWFAGPDQERPHIDYGENADKLDLTKMVGGVRQSSDYRLRQFTMKKMVRYSIVIMLILAIPLLWLTYEDIITKSPEKEIGIIFEESAYENVDLGGVVIDRNYIKVTIYNFDPMDGFVVQDLDTKIKSRIDSRYMVEYNIVQASRETF